MRRLPPRHLSLETAPIASPPHGCGYPHYDAQVLLNSQPVIVTVVDPSTHRIQFQKQTGLKKFGDMGSTYGAIAAAVAEAQQAGKRVSQVHLRYLNPLPSDLGDILGRFKHVLVPEMNMGQLIKVLRAECLVNAVGLNKVQGLPFKVAEITNRINRMLEG